MGFQFLRSSPFLLFVRCCLHPPCSPVSCSAWDLTVLSFYSVFVQLWLQEHIIGCSLKDYQPFSICQSVVPCLLSTSQLCFLHYSSQVPFFFQQILLPPILDLFRYTLPLFLGLSSILTSAMVTVGRHAVVLHAVSQTWMEQRKPWPSFLRTVWWKGVHCRPQELTDNLPKTCMLVMTRVKHFIESLYTPFWFGDCNMLLKIGRKCSIWV